MLGDRDVRACRRLSRSRLTAWLSVRQTLVWMTDRLVGMFGFTSPEQGGHSDRNGEALRTSPFLSPFIGPPFLSRPPPWWSFEHTERARNVFSPQRLCLAIRLAYWCSPWKRARVSTSRSPEPMKALTPKIAIAVLSVGPPCVGRGAELSYSVLFMSTSVTT